AIARQAVSDPLVHASRVDQPLAPRCEQSEGPSKVGCKRTELQCQATATRVISPKGNHSAFGRFSDYDAGCRPFDIRSRPDVVQCGARRISGRLMGSKSTRALTDNTEDWPAPRRTA